MTIKSIEINNFKSFKHDKVSLGQLNVIIGANASGKSNFIHVFKFLRDINNHGFTNAVAMQGGGRYLLNSKLGFAQPLAVKIVSDKELKIPLYREEKGNNFVIAQTNEVTYSFSVKFITLRLFRIVSDSITLKCNFFSTPKSKYDQDRDDEEEKEGKGTGTIVVYKSGDRIDYHVEVDKNASVDSEKVYSRLKFFQEIGGKPYISASNLLMELAFPLLFSAYDFEDLFAEIAIYDFDPKLPKRALRMIGKAELEEDGSNLAIVLKDIRLDLEKRRAFSNLISDLLPFVDDWRVKEFSADRSLLFTLREKYYPESDIPAFLISDGTINVIALITAIFFQEKSLCIIEEPERNIHPYLISKVVNMLKDASRNKQIIVSTHNAEVVKYSGLENILLISRDNDGFSTISKPVDRKDLKVFLKHEMGIDEIFIQNLFEV